MTDFLTIATSKLGLNLVGPYDRFRWRQQIEGYPYHKNTKVKETTNMVDLVQRDILPGEGMEAPIQLSVLVLDCLLLLYMAHVIYSIQVIFNPYYVTR